jgi:phage nucleotide-binding protein
MSIKITTSAQAAQSNGVKALVYGVAGSGKTSLSATFGDIPTVVISCESGLLSIADADLPVIEIKTMNDLSEAYLFLTQNQDGQRFKAIVIDSVSEIAEVLLAEEKKTSKDARAAYGNTSEKMMELLRAFRDVAGRHVLFISKLEKVKDEMNGALMYGPSMPGQRLGQAIPYLVDEVFALRVEKDGEGNVSRWLQTTPDFQWQAKDRSGKLDPFEPTNMDHIIKKISGIAG